MQTSCFKVQSIAVWKFLDLAILWPRRYTQISESYRCVWGTMAKPSSISSNHFMYTRTISVKRTCKQPNQPFKLLASSIRLVIIEKHIGMQARRYRHLLTLITTARSQASPLLPSGRSLPLHTIYALALLSQVVRKENKPIAGKC